MSDRSTFWKNDTQWPNDSESYLFLARALNRLGKSIFPSSWTGTEFATETFKFADYIWHDPRFANNLLAEHHPNSGRHIIHAPQPSNIVRGKWGEGDPTGSAIADMIGAIQRDQELDVILSKDEMGVARTIAEKIDAQNEAIVHRAEKAKADFVRLSREGRVATAYRSLGTNIDVPIPPVWWDTEVVEFRFYCGQLNPMLPFGKERVGGAWIFVSRTSVDWLTANSPPEVPDGARVIPNTPMASQTREAVRLALLDSFKTGYVAIEWTWENIASYIEEPYKRRMKERGLKENAPPSVGTVRRVFGEG